MQRCGSLPIAEAGTAKGIGGKIPFARLSRQVDRQQGAKQAPGRQELRSGLLNGKLRKPRPLAGVSTSPRRRGVDRRQGPAPPPSNIDLAFWRYRKYHTLSPRKAPRQMHRSNWRTVSSVPAHSLMPPADWSSDPPSILTGDGQAVPLRLRIAGAIEYRSSIADFQTPEDTPSPAANASNGCGGRGPPLLDR